MANFGVITEQNDLGLNFMPLNEKDNAAINEYVSKDRTKDHNVSVINEDKKNK
ncbi:MAG: hypothetical protein IKR19_08850 [Acholeplasmatales bacterium]|jgi:hypothetical protein|nr:hypothetical protein [Acholeplasmatales bacterium]